MRAEKGWTDERFIKQILPERDFLLECRQQKMLI